MKNPSVAAWDAWFETCSIRRCSADHRAELEEFARIRFAKAARDELRTAANQAIRDLLGSGEAESTACFSLFEVYSQTNPKMAVDSKKPAPGKLYKERLKEIRKKPKSGDPALNLARYSSSFFQPAVRKWFFKEIPRNREIVPSQTAAPGTDGLTMDDLIQGPNKGRAVRKEHTVSDDANREDAEILTQAATKIFKTWNERERYGQWAKVHGISTDNPVLHHRVGRGRDAIWNAQKSARGKIHDILKEVLASYHPEETDEALNLVGRTLISLLEDWSKSENLRPDDFQ